jgi:hypothetical protein
VDLGDFTHLSRLPHEAYAAPFAVHAIGGPPAAAHVRDAAVSSPKLMTFNSNRRHFVYAPRTISIFVPPVSGGHYRHTFEEDENTLRRYWTRRIGAFEVPPGPATAESSRCRVSNSIYLVAAPSDILNSRGLARVQGSKNGLAGSGASGHQ